MADPCDRLALSARTVPELGPSAVVECAVATGYRRAGVRLDDPRSQAPSLARAMAHCGVGLLEVGVVRLRPGPLTDADRRLADTAGALGAAYLRVVDSDPDEAAVLAKLAELRELVAGSPTRPALAVVAGSRWHRPADAERAACAVRGSVVLLDPLHLHRAGEPLDRSAVPALTGYARLTDARITGTGDERVPPGAGTLDLRGFTDALPPDAALALAVGSDALTGRYGALARAELVRVAAERLLRGTVAPGPVPTSTVETCAGG